MGLSALCECPNSFPPLALQQLLASSVVIVCVDGRSPRMGLLSDDQIIILHSTVHSRTSTPRYAISPLRMPRILNGMHAHADIVGVNAGKQWMRRRKPVNVKSFSIVHNAIMFFASLYMVIETLRQVGRAPVGEPLPISDLIPEGNSKSQHSQNVCTGLSCNVLCLMQGCVLSAASAEACWVWLCRKCSYH